MDHKISITGSIVSLFIGWIGHITLNSMTLWLGVISAGLTIVYTLYKFGKEIIKDFKK